MGTRAFWLSLISASLAVGSATAGEPTHARIDALIEAKAQAFKVAPSADDAEFVRRVYLDLAGRIPKPDEARAFVADASPKKREALIDRLLSGPEYPKRMADLVHVMLMERRGDDPTWTAYLQTAFAEDRPWDRMAREMLLGSSPDDKSKGAPFFLSKRLEHYGENPVDYPGLTTDVGRLMLGIDLRCAQCHDHLFVDEYKQRDFQGLFAFFQNAAPAEGKIPGVVEKPTTSKLTFASVFNGRKHETGPRVPGDGEVAVPKLAKGEEYVRPPDRKKGFPGELRFSPLKSLSEHLPRPENRAFARNMANRLWLAFMGRGLVHPPDQTHADNPASHPELLDLLTDELIAEKFGVKEFTRELLLTKCYARTSILPDPSKIPPPELFLVALEKRMSAEQLAASLLQALGEPKKLDRDAFRAKFVKAFANAPGEPEDEFSPSLKAALFLENDSAVLSLFEPADGNLTDRLAKMGDADRVADELYWSVLSRAPDPEERKLVASVLAASKSGRGPAVKRLVWSLIASTEFCLNH